MTSKVQDVLTLWKMCQVRFSTSVERNPQIHHRWALEGPDGWSEGCVRNYKPRPLRLKCQQGRDSVTLWAGIIGAKLISHWQVPLGVNFTVDAYIEFPNHSFVPWYKCKALELR